MILVDTSVWIDHLHQSDAHLAQALEADDVATHDLVIEELAAGSLADRQTFLGLLSHLTSLPRLSHHEVLAFLQAERLSGRGLSVVDCHLLGSLRLRPDVALWTRDRRLAAAATDLGLKRVTSDHPRPPE